MVRFDELYAVKTPKAYAIVGVDYQREIEEGLPPIVNILSESQDVEVLGKVSSNSYYTFRGAGSSGIRYEAVPEIVPGKQLSSEEAEKFMNAFIADQLSR